MDEVTDSIVASVKSGQYFKDARRAYVIRYLYPIIERTFCLILASILLVSFYFVYISLGFDEKMKSPTYVINISRDSKYIQFYEKLAEHESYVSAVSEYLVKYYVGLREEYNYTKKGMNRMLSEILSTSSRSVYKEYEYLIDQQNPISPINLLGKGGRKNMSIKSLNLLGGVTTPNQAELIIDVTTRYASGKQKVETKKIDISFNISIQENSRGRVQYFDFVITRYNARRVQ